MRKDNLALDINIVKPWVSNPARPKETINGVIVSPVVRMKYKYLLQPGIGNFKVRRTSSKRFNTFI